MRNVTLKFYNFFVFSVLHNFTHKILCEITMVFAEYKRNSLSEKRIFLDSMFDTELIKNQQSNKRASLTECEGCSFSLFYTKNNIK